MSLIAATIEFQNSDKVPISRVVVERPCVGDTLLFAGNPYEYTVIKVSHLVDPQHGTPSTIVRVA